MIVNERSQFRVLYRHALSQLIDPELLRVGGEPRNFIGQLAALLAAFSLVYSLVRVPSVAFATAVELKAATWRDEDLLLSATMAVAGLLMLLAWDRILPDPKDALTLSLTPVRLRTVFLAKLAAICSGVGVAVVALNCFSGLSYPLLISPEGGTARSVIAYWLCIAVSGLFVCCSILAIECMLALVLSRRLFLRVSGFVQLLAFLGMMALCFVKPPFPNASELAEPANQTLIELLPSFWFVGLLHHLNASGNESFASLAAWAGAGSVAALSIAVVTYPIAFAKSFRRVVEQPDIAPRKWLFFELHTVRVFRERLLGQPVRQALVLFVVRTLARSRQHRLILASYLGIGVALVLVYPADLLYHGDTRDWREPNVPMLAASLIMLFLTIAGLRAAFALPVALPSNWIFRTTSVQRPASYFEAARTSVFFLAIAPLWLIAALTYLSTWPGRPAILHMVLLTLVAVLLVHCAFYKFRKLPFACSYFPEESSSAASWGAYAIGFLFVVDAAARLQLWSVKRIDRFIPVVVLLLAVAVWSRRRTLEFDRAPSNRVQFETSPRADINPLDIRPDGAWSGDDAYVDSIDPSFGRSLGSRLRAAGITFATVVALGVGYEQIGQWRDGRRFPQIGRSIDIGGRTLNLHCLGEGNPTVIFEAGHGGPGLIYAHVQREVARFTRACWYDRAGRGWSDPGPNPSYADSIARDLHGLLQEAHEPPPYVLVGSSLGGLYVRVFTGFYEDEVVGMVLVDPVVEDFHEPDGRSKAIRTAMLPIGEIIGSLGFFRLMEPTPGPPKGEMAPDEWAALINLMWRTENVQANSKSKPVRPSAEQARVSGGLEKLPLVVLSAGEGSDFGYSPISFWASRHEDEERELHGFRVQLHKKLAARSQFGRHKVVEGSGHGITLEAPDAVIDAIREVVIQSRMKPATLGH
jgi:pimeloyl-ACP methyl ester carboxylesterase